MSSKFKNTNEFVNTKLLLENYRNIQIAINCREIDEVISYSEKNEVDMMKVFKSGRINNRRMQLLISKDNYRLIRYLEKSVNAFRNLGDKFEKHYAVLFYTYLTLEEYSFEEILEKLDLKRSTYYYVLDNAIQALSTALWGVSAVKNEEFGNLCVSFVKYVPTIENKDMILEACLYLVNNLPSATSPQDKELITDMINTLKTKISLFDELI